MAVPRSVIKEGKVRMIGASNYSAARLKNALEISSKYGFPSYISLQPEYNFYTRANFETELEKLCIEENIGVISYSSLASGFLSGKYRSELDLEKSVRGNGIGKKYLNKRGFNILSALDDIAKKHNTVPAAVALAWIIQRKSITAPIVSATSVPQLMELINATTL